MLRSTRRLALYTTTALALSAGCTPDGPNVAGPDLPLDQEGLAARGPDFVRHVGATQFSGVGFFSEPGECEDVEGAGSDFSIRMTGDLEGCHYVYVESAVCTPGGTYRERGTETFVGEYNGASGTFRTTYLFTARFADCANLVGEIVGRCQHPRVAGSGQGVFEGVTGRFDMKDDVDTGRFHYRGHFRT